jgi:hypothetical protein
MDADEILGVGFVNRHSLKQFFYTGSIYERLTEPQVGEIKGIRCLGRVRVGRWINCLQGGLRHRRNSCSRLGLEVRCGGRLYFGSCRDYLAAARFPGRCLPWRPGFCPKVISACVEVAKLVAPLSPARADIARKQFEEGAARRPD